MFSKSSRNLSRKSTKFKETALEATRTFFWNVGHVRIAIYILAMAPIAFLVYGLYKRYLLWRQGTPDDRTNHLSDRIYSFIENSLLQKRIFREPYGGTMHGFIFFGFVALFIGTTLIALQEDITLPLLHWEYLKGNFYLYYSLILDIFGALAIVGTLMALYRRIFLKPDRLDHRWDDNLVLYLFLFILITGFLLEGFRVHANELPLHPAWSRWSPIGLAMAFLFKGLGISPETSLDLHRFFWWSHLIAAFTFIALIPYTKLIHIFTGSADTFLRPDPPVGRLEPIDIENSETFGVEKYSEFTWKHLFDLDACVRCGRCQDVCPAYLSGKPLSPKAFIQDLRSGLNRKTGGEDQTSIIGDIIQEDTLWACTTCRACEEACPLLIEHVPKHLEFRRHQVLVLTKFPSELRTTFRNLERQGNPWGVPKSQRGEWTEGLDVPLFEPGMAEEGFLLWVGCACSVDEKNIKTAIAMVRLLKSAGIPFGILGRQEKCCGEPSRRLGNEYVFQLEAEENIELFKELGVKRIITLCPHGYHVFKNEYPDFGGIYEVYHYTEILRNILKNVVLNGNEAPSQSVTYHDPCYLGRYNEIYGPPRDIIKETGNTLKEMAHHGNKSLCCGGGGGHIWMEEQMGQRISHLRIDEAVQTGSPLVLTACPHCLTMLTDGVKEKELDDKIEVMDIANWLAAHVKDGHQP